jgi:hypothetical protein
VTPISTLSEWTDVLQLSTKWGFEHLRTAAITAILPLASAMDKLVLGRTYGFVDWVSDAYTDLLKREDDLTLDEAKKMALEDVVAIAKGRREARTQRIKPDAAIEEIVQSILPVMNLERKALEDPNSHVDMVAPGPSTVAGPIPQQSYASSVPANDRAKIVRWVSQMQSPPPSRSAPGDCLVKFMQEDRIRVPVVLDTVLERGLKSFRAAKGVKVDSSSRYYSRKTYLNTWSQCADGGRFLDLLNMSSQDPLLQLSTSHQAEAAALRLVDRWQLLAQIDFNIPTEEWIASEPWSSLRCATTYLAYLVDGPESTPDYSSSVVGSSVFLTFWTTLAALHRSTSPRYRLSLAEYTKSILSQVKEYVSKVEVSVEIDAFYLLLEEARDAAQPHINDQDHELVGVLNVSLRSLIVHKTLTMLITPVHYRRQILATGMTATNVPFMYIVHPQFRLARRECGSLDDMYH